MRHVGLGSVLAVVTLALGCGGNSPTAPRVSRISGLAISGVDAVLTGVSTTYTVTATLADGTSQPITPVWSSSNPEVATVDRIGLLQARSHGSTTLTASSDGQMVSKTIHVVNNYGGTWEGRFIVNRCDPQPFCAAMETDVFSFPIYLQLSQSGADWSDINAKLILSNFNNLRANVSGKVTSDGRLNLGGHFEVSDSRDRIWATLDLGEWDTILSGGEGMTGHWTQRLNILQPASTEYLENELVGMKRSNTGQ